MIFIGSDVFAKGHCLVKSCQTLSAGLLAVSSIEEWLGLGELQCGAPAVVAEKLDRAAEVKVDEHKPQKRKVCCLVKRKVNLIDDTVDKQQKRTNTTALPYTIPECRQNGRVNKNPRIEPRHS